MHMSVSATAMLLRTAGSAAPRSWAAKWGTHALASASSPRHSFPSAVHACACNHAAIAHESTTARLFMASAGVLPCILLRSACHCSRKLPLSMWVALKDAAPNCKGFVFVRNFPSIEIDFLQYLC